MTENTESPQSVATDIPEHKRRIKSFVLRQGRLSQAQQNAIDTMWPQYGLTLEDKLLDFNTLFGREAPTIIEIGFGMGNSLAAMAEAHPENNYIGIEVHRPGVGALLKLVAEKGLTNVRVFNEDAIEVLNRQIPKNSLSAVYLFFPDPWHKTKHKKRRILQAEFAEKIAQYLAPGGQFHMATDWEDYALHMMSVMSAAKGYRNISGEGQYTPRPDYRPLTKFEQRGHRLGHGVWDLVFERI
ncbi:MAG: tRNA (guanosine(46)-N7)-methyltransferase TrmB [Hydrogenovibrio crunogenus]|uniref:tRNA (guanine-N(7)-)-methyltransferase n=1 Tax=Hydrogenovibrio crunogenus (strain DSM 25203 / XCL-2) TaxID=317025 RepID=TRMB_HYDCU|nr:RecName: Full=tRNA (guanine-N(7)-)-methyltransferase; AltName: Full=tRNA (guanine(46)-N(7))-methyltransferase; AltName: Full=tRNA(m7G46)-methyltransferase [Hydrogenovibrio crunogenus XCL-2]MBD3612498.1 tRNA (guanosine(46)-N7)-methyltransferase TrmB [Hydrogenovibrio crunogenus]